MKIISKKFFNNLAGAWIFYTIFPELPIIKPRFRNIAQFAPLIGIIIGIIQSLIFIILSNNNWPISSSIVLCILSGFLITGGLHTDGLMDTVDGIFAGQKKILKAMKDSSVGSFGVQAIIIIILIQFASLLKIHDEIITVLPVCLFWGRFSTLFFIDRFKYISFKTKSISHKKYWRGFKRESTISILLLFLIIINYFFYDKTPLEITKYLLIMIFGLFLSYKIPNVLGSKVGGFNGDTCGASVLFVETSMMFIYAIVL